jgi:hypothetical protein
LRARTVSAAVNAELDRLRPLVACVTNRPFFASYQAGTPSPVISLHGPAPLRLAQGARLLFFFVLTFDALRAENETVRFQLRPAGYRYQILEADGREILAFHWHPRGPSSAVTPHLHLSSRIPPIPVGSHTAVRLAQMHIPTGFVSLPEIIRLLVIEFGVEPRRQDWQALVSLVPDAQGGAS